MTLRNRNGSKLITPEAEDRKYQVEETKTKKLEQQAGETLVVVAEPASEHPATHKAEPLPAGQVVSTPGQPVSPALKPAKNGLPAGKAAYVEAWQEALSSETQPSTPHSTQAQEHGVPMTGDALLAEAGRSFLYHQYHKLRKAEPVAREGSDPEGVHDMRVATRRLRAGLQILEETVYLPAKAGRLRRQLRDLANSLGQTRDTDVFIQQLETYTENLPETERTGLDPLFKILRKRRKDSARIMLKTLDNPRTEKLFERLKTFVTTPGAGVVEDRAGKAEVAPSLVRHFAGSAIWRHYEAVLAYECAVKPEQPASTPVATLHRLRIACKRLRYTLEFFEEALPAEAQELHAQLVDVQEVLGELHDNQVALDLVTPLLKTDQDQNNPVLQAYRDSREAERERLLGNFAGKWQVLSGLEFRRKLATAIAGTGSA